MIEDSPVLKLKRNIARPAQSAISALRDTPTGFIVDCMDGRGALHHQIKPLLPLKQPIVGIAVTCECGPADNLGVLGALDIAELGDIILASTDAHMGAAVIGDLVLEMMKNKGVLAFVTDGLARDLDGIERVGLPIFCKGITPNSPSRNGPAKAGFGVSLDSSFINSGDVVVADRDGVVVVPSEQLTVVCEKLESVKEAEKKLLSAVESGLVLPPFYEELVSSGKVIDVDT